MTIFFMQTKLQVSLKCPLEPLKTLVGQNSLAKLESVFNPKASNMQPLVIQRHLCHNLQPCRVLFLTQHPWN